MAWGFLMRWIIFLNAAKRNHRSNIAFIIVGIGPEKDRLVERQRAEGISNLFFLDAVTKGHIPSMLSLFDLLYIGWKPHSLYRFGIAPNKLIDYMMAGKPIIHANNASNDLVGIADCGLSIEPDNVDQVNEAIDRLYKYARK